jgi:hypothetical protein
MESSFTHGRQVTHDFETLQLPVIALNAGYAPTDSASMHKYGVEVFTMRCVGHFLMMEDPRRFNEILRSAIKRFK